MVENNKPISGNDTLTPSVKVSLVVLVVKLNIASEQQAVLNTFLVSDWLFTSSHLQKVKHLKLLEF